MSRILAPIFFFVIGIGLFFSYIDPAYNHMKELREDNTRLDAALTKSKELQEARDALLARYNTMPSADIAHLERLLPDNVDNVKLILDIDNIASNHSIILGDFEFDAEPLVEDVYAGDEIVQDTTSPEAWYEAAELRFSVLATYDEFLAFLKDLERSLRIVDVRQLRVGNVGDADAQKKNEAATGNRYEFVLSINSYWLRNE